MPAQSKSIRVNNFDLIRLFAAMQVAIEHGITHLKVPELAGASYVLGHFPGVPIFFVISGFLISMSWERAPSLRQYTWNRILRIYPALWVCLALSTALFLACGVRPDTLPGFFTWVLAQSTLFQYYNPDFLRGFGVGVINGSLWTIPVELEFYILLPLLALLAGTNRWIWLGYAAAAAAMMVAARLYIGELVTIPEKLLAVSLLPYLFFFVIGVIARHVYEDYPGVFRSKALLWALVYAAWLVLAFVFGIGGTWGNRLSVVSIVLLAALTVAVAFSKPELSSRLLHENDISYGVYIYHMPVINALLFAGLAGAYPFIGALVLTVTCAGLSWRLVEKPALGLKNYSLRPARPSRV